MPHPVLIRRVPVNTYPNQATNLVRASGQRWSVADNAATSMADIDFSVAGWIYLNQLGITQIACAKGTTSTATTEFALFLNSANTLRWQVSNGAASLTLSATTLGTLAINTWYFVYGLHDSVGNTISVGGNLITDSTALTTGSFDSTQALTFGAISGGGSELDGRLDAWGVWKNEALSAASLATLYKGGVGMAYRDLPAALKTNLVAWYDFDGTGNDAHSANHLTGTNNPSFAAGKR